MQLPENWNDLTPEERREFRFGVWASAEGKEFASDEVREEYVTMVKRLIDVISLRQPDRVPRFFESAGFTAQYAGITHRDMFYDYPTAVAASKKVMDDFDLDVQFDGVFYPGPLFDHVQFQSYRWPGGSPVLKDTQPFQAIDAEFMPAEDYDELIENVEMYMLKKYTPTVLPALSGLRYLPTAVGTVELPFIGPTFAQMANPEVQEALENMLKAGKLAAEYMSFVGEIAAHAELVHGMPPLVGGVTKVPLDYVGDTLRGTRFVMMDIRRRPEKLLAAAEAFIKPAIDIAVGAANVTGIPLIFIPLHKGADPFMSTKQFEEFYLPNMKALFDGLIEEGLVPHPFVEGAYNQRLDSLANAGFASGCTMWRFDQTDMAAAKEKIGSWGAIGGNVPSSAFATMNPDQIDALVKNLMETCAPGGGYYIHCGANVDEAKVENVHAYLAAAKKYGTY